MSDQGSKVGDGIHENHCASIPVVVSGVLDTVVVKPRGHPGIAGSITPTGRIQDRPHLN